MRCINSTFLVCFMAGVLASTPALAKKKSFSEHSDMISAAIDNGRLVQASAMLSKMKPDAARSPEVQILEGELALAQRKNAEALRLFSPHLEHPSLECRAREGAGIALVRKGDKRASVEHLAAVTVQCPDRWKSWNTMAVLLSHFKKWNASEHAFGQAITLSDRDPVTLNNYGFSLMSQKKFMEARTHFAEALGKQPDNVQYQNNLDIVQAVMGQRPEKSKSQSEQRWIERLNNSGHAARLAGHERMGVALLTEAVLNSRTMASTAATNLNFGQSGESGR